MKADAYGLGVEPVARRLAREGCSKFFVATLAEAQQLRPIVPHASIYVFDGVVGDEANALARIVLMFDGRDTEAVSGARAAWRAAKEASHEVTYWKESPSGKWEKQA